MKIHYITKYWLNSGILRSDREGWSSDDGKRHYAWYKNSVCRIGSDAFPTLEEAVADVRERAMKKAVRAAKDVARFTEIAKGVGIKVPE